jgi:hypothetical protein
MRKNQLLLFVTFFAAMVITSCSKDGNEVTPAATSHTAQMKASPVKTISGSITYQADMNYDLPCDCGPYFNVGTFSGSGTISHLGLATSSIKPCLSPTVVNGVPGYHVAQECATLFAANGDQLICETLPYDILFTPTGLGIGNLEVVFNGGTGKFAGATGGFTGTVTIDMASGSAVLSNLTGTIVN